ncbi:DUF202 domain-containing protein [Kitasatospora azatica]|uniref:DUF202 domain-containing protein n=1 Tax=Kitasatospora azatica TaxID=58347 RepID=UPI00056B36D8|nr:DUF202 domain-containing protein [Kitasatospora azatica]
MNERPDPVRDPGLQAERTVLAWSRTAMVLAVNAALVLRTGLVKAEPGLTALGALLAAAACALYAFGVRRRRELELGPEPRAVRAAPLRAVAATIALVAVATVWAVLLSR